MHNIILIKVLSGIILRSPHYPPLSGGNEIFNRLISHALVGWSTSDLVYLAVFKRVGHAKKRTVENRTNVFGMLNVLHNFLMSTCCGLLYIYMGSKAFKIGNESRGLD